MDSEAEIRAGEILEKLGNKKSKILIAALNEYASNHPELNMAHEVKERNILSIPMDLLEMKIKEIINRDIQVSEVTETTPTSNICDTLDPNLISMLDDLELF